MITVLRRQLLIQLTARYIHLYLIPGMKMNHDFHEVL